MVYPSFDIIFFGLLWKLWQACGDSFVRQSLASSELHALDDLEAKGLASNLYTIEIESLASNFQDSL